MAILTRQAARRSLAANQGGEATHNSNSTSVLRRASAQIIGNQPAERKRKQRGAADTRAKNAKKAKLPKVVPNIATLEEMVIHNHENYFYKPVVKGAYLFNVSNEVVQAAVAAMVAKVVDIRKSSGDEGWNSSDELEYGVVHEFSRILEEIHKRAIHNAGMVKKQVQVVL